MVLQKLRGQTDHCTIILMLLHILMVQNELSCQISSSVLVQSGNGPELTYISYCTSKDISVVCVSQYKLTLHTRGKEQSLRGPTIPLLQCDKISVIWANVVWIEASAADRNR